MSGESARVFSLAGPSGLSDGKKYRDFGRFATGDHHVGVALGTALDVDERFIAGWRRRFGNPGGERGVGADQMHAHGGGPSLRSRQGECGPVKVTTDVSPFSVKCFDPRGSAPAHRNRNQRPSRARSLRIGHVC